MDYITASANFHINQSECLLVWKCVLLPISSFPAHHLHKWCWSALLRQIMSFMLWAGQRKLMKTFMRVWKRAGRWNVFHCVKHLPPEHSNGLVFPFLYRWKSQRQDDTTHYYKPKTRSAFVLHHRRKKDKWIYFVMFLYDCKNVN